MVHEISFKRFMTNESLLYSTENYSVICGDLNGKEIQKRGAICICIADSLCCRVEITE